MAARAVDRRRRGGRARVALDPALLALATHEATGEELERQDREARASGRLLSTSEPPFRSVPFESLPTSSQARLVERAAAVAERYAEWVPGG